MKNRSVYNIPVLASQVILKRKISNTYSQEDLERVTNKYCNYRRANIFIFIYTVDSTRVNDTGDYHGCINSDKKLRKPAAAVALSIENRTGQIRIYRTRLCRYAERTQRSRPVIYLLAAAYLPTSI